MISHRLIGHWRVRSTFGLILTLGLTLGLITELAAQERGHRGLPGDRLRVERGARHRDVSEDRARVERWLEKLPEQQRRELVQKLGNLPKEQRRKLIETLAKRSPQQRLEFLRDHHRIHQRMSTGDAAETKRIHRRHEHFRKLRQEFRDSLSASQRPAFDQLPQQQQKRRFFQWLQRRKYVEKLDAAGRARFDALSTAAQAHEVGTWMEKRKRRWREACRGQYLEQLSAAQRAEFEALPAEGQRQRMHEWARQQGFRQGWHRRGHRQRHDGDARQVRFRRIRLDYVKTLSPEAREEFLGLRESQQWQRVGKWHRKQRGKDPGHPAQGRGERVPRRDRGRR